MYFPAVFDGSAPPTLAEMAGRRQAFQANPELQQFVLPEVRPTGRQLGVGSYGSVEEVEVNGLVCAGKRLHDALVEQGNAGVSSITRKYLQECQVMPSPCSKRSSLDSSTATLPAGFNNFHFTDCNDQLLYSDSVPGEGHVIAR